MSGYCVFMDGTNVYYVEGTEEGGSLRCHFNLQRLHLKFG